jgi:hypothetical protein
LSADEQPITANSATIFISRISQLLGTTIEERIRGPIPFAWVRIKANPAISPRGKYGHGTHGLSVS